MTVSGKIGGKSTRKWSFLTQHAVVLTCIARQPGSTVRQLTSVTGVSSNALRRVITDLNNTGYVHRQQVGSEGRYSVHPNPTPVNMSSRESAFLEFIKALGW